MSSSAQKTNWLFADNMTIRLLSTTKLTNCKEGKLRVETVCLYPRGWPQYRKVFFLLRQIANCDVFLAFNPSIEHEFVAVLNRLFFRRTKIIFSTYFYINRAY